jgi:hypothetical protein
MTTNYSELTDSFEQCDIDAGAFAHADHVGVAYEMLTRYDFLEASMRYARCINTIATAAGAADKFNVTITLAFLSLIAERMHTTEYTSYEEFLDKNPDVLEKTALNQWYTSDRLASELARSVFLMPEVAAA